MQPKVSIIIPAYNQGFYLPETLESVLAQTYENWECVIVNDGSNDNTEEVALQYCKKDARFRYLYKTNGGLSSARNTGINASMGTYILPLDSDDLIGREYVQLAVEALETNPKVGIVYCQVKLFGKKKGIWDHGLFSHEKMIGANQIICSSFFRRTDFDKTCGYRADMKYGLEDWDFWLSLLELDSNIEVYQIPQVLFFYRIRSSSMLRTMTSEQASFLRHLIWENHRQLFSKYCLDPKNSFEYKTIIQSAEYRVGNFIIKPIRKLLGR